MITLNGLKVFFLFLCLEGHRDGAGEGNRGPGERAGAPGRRSLLLAAGVAGAGLPPPPLCCVGRIDPRGKRPPKTGVSSLVWRTPSAPLIGTRPPSPAAPVPFHPLPPMVGAVSSRHPLQLPLADGAPLSAIAAGGCRMFLGKLCSGDALCLGSCVCVGGGDGVNFCLRSLQRHKGRAILSLRSHGNSSWDCLT